MIMTNKYKFKKLCALSLALVLTFSAFGRMSGNSAIKGHADETKDKYEAQLNELREQQAQIDAQLADADAQIAAEHDNLDAINKKYKNLRLKIDNVEQQNEELEDQMVELDSQLRDASEELKVMNAEIEVERDEFMERMRTMYVAGGTVSYENVLINSADFYDVLMRVELVKRVAAYDDETLDGLMEKKRKIEATEAEIKEKTDKLKTKAQDYAETQAELMEKQNELTKLIIESGDKINTLENDKTALREQYERLSSDYDRIYSLAQTTTTTTTAATEEVTTVSEKEEEEKPVTTTTKKSGEETSKATTTKKSAESAPEERTTTAPVTAAPVTQTEPETTTEPEVEYIPETTTTTPAPVETQPEPEPEPEPEPADDSRDAKIQTVVNYAKSNVGGAYVWAGENFKATDCSGLMLLSYRQIGINLPHFAASQATYGTSVSYEDIQPGDLIFFGTDIHHVGMYIGDGKMVHAANEDIGIVISDLGNYLKYEYLYGIRRLV